MFFLCGFRSFLFERRQENVFVELEGLNFCSASGLRSFLLELGFRGFLLGFYSILLARW